MIEFKTGGNLNFEKGYVLHVVKGSVKNTNTTDFNQFGELMKAYMTHLSGATLAERVASFKATLNSA